MFVLYIFLIVIKEKRNQTKIIYITWGQQPNTNPLEYLFVTKGTGFLSRNFIMDDFKIKKPAKKFFPKSKSAEFPIDRFSEHHTSFKKS